MSPSDQTQVTTQVSSIPTEHRTKLRVGFALCSSAFLLALVFTIVSLGAVQVASSSDAQFRETHDFELRLAGNLASAAIDVLLIGGPDYFGDTVNMASKLGEDQARPGEILITARALAQIPANAGFQHEVLELELSGVTISAASIRY